jgi:hypothetical protein
MSELRLVMDVAVSLLVADRNDHFSQNNDQLQLDYRSLVYYCSHTVLSVGAMRMEMRNPSYAA